MSKLQTVRDLRRANRRSVLSALYFDGPSSRVQLSATTGLSPATVGNVIGDFLKEGVLLETGQVESDGGRPATLLDVGAEQAFSVGVDLGEEGVRVELFDLRLRRVAATHGFTNSSEPAVMVALIARLVDEVCASIPVGGELLGVGVGVPGIVDGRDAPVVHAPSLGWKAVPLQAMLASATGANVVIDNGVKTMGRAEAWFGGGKGVDDLIVVLIGTGVGAALLTNGVVNRGVSSSAGEWGHTKVVLNGKRCRCGAAGCLEAYLGADAIADRFRRLNKSLPVELSRDEVLQRLCDDLELGRAPARRTLDETATYLAAGIGDLTNLLNPSLIVVGGDIGLLLGPALLPLVRDRLGQFALAPAVERLTLALSDFGPDAVALGAATLPIEQFLASGGNRLPGGAPAPGSTKTIASVRSAS
jgi:predicted NBD/HSP70 family sugar kinase